MQNSQIQHDSPNASQTIRTGTSLDDISHFLESLREARPELALPEQVSAELDAEIATLQTQLASPKPKHTIIQEALRSVRSILEGVAGSAIATGLLAAMAGLV